MLPDRLQARIRAQLELPAPDLEARVLAAELAELAKRARERLEQCAALIRIGNEQAALQAAEAEPRLLDLCAWLGFADGDRWQSLCRENGLPLAPSLDDGHIVAVELLYGKPIDESHPLYRDYRQAIRERDEARALGVLRTIASANPGDGNARAELARLGTKFARDSANRVADLFAEGRSEDAVALMDRMERLGVASLAGEPSWEDSLRRRREWTESRARRRLDELAASARDEMAEGRWEACAAAVGVARTLERNLGIRADGQAAEDLASAESWAGARVAAAREAAAAAAHVAELVAELDQLRVLAGGTPDAAILRRLGRWQERAAAADRLPEGLAEEAALVRADLHRRVVRRHTLLTAVWLALLLGLVAGGRAAWGHHRAEEQLRGTMAEARAMAEAGDSAGAEARLDALGDPAGLGPEARREAADIRGLLARRAADEDRLGAEADVLRQAAQGGITPANFADLRRRAVALESAVAQVGPAAARRIRARAGDLPALVARCDQVARSVAPEVRGLVARLEAAMGVGAALADPEAARGLVARIRELLDVPETRAAVDPDLVDRALARADLAEERLRREARAELDGRRLATAGDLRAYLAALAEVAATETPTPESRAAAAAVAGAAALSGLPRVALGPRAGAMWDALGEPAAAPGDWTGPELAALSRATDDRVLRSVRRFIIREHSAQGERATAALIATGEVTREQRRFRDGTETVTSASVLRRNGEISAETWSLRRFTNGAISGEELTEGLPLPETEYLRRFLRSFDPASRRPGEPLLRTAERVRAESGSNLLRAFHLQELLAAASVRPAASNLAFSPSAQADAREIRRLTQNNLGPTDFLFPDKWADVRADLDRFLAQPAPAYAEEARFLRAALAAAKEGGLTYAGRVGPDSQAVLREPLPGVVLLGIAADGQPAALFRTDAAGRPTRLRDPLPLSPLLRMAVSLDEAARRAGKPPASLARPSAGWESLLAGQDL